MEGESFGEVLIYETDGKIDIDVKFSDDTVWLTQAQMCALYGSSKSNVSEHIKNIFDEGELDAASTVRIFRTVAANGKSYNMTYYSLDMIVALGYRIKSIIATRFRQWATARLKEYMKKGFALDDKRLKGEGGGEYWKELLERIRDIRSSEKVMYRQVLDLYATSADYNPKSAESTAFFKMVQNKLHYAAHGHTASEVIFERADATKPFMGLTSFAGGFPHKKDIGIAKNYLNADELDTLNRIVSGYFDFAELQAKTHKKVYMTDYVEQLNKILQATNNKVLEGAGKVSHKQALNKANKEYQKFIVENPSPVEEAYMAATKQIDAIAQKHGY